VEAFAHLVLSQIVRQGFAVLFDLEHVLERVCFVQRALGAFSFNRLRVSPFPSAPKAGIVQDATVSQASAINNNDAFFHTVFRLVGQRQHSMGGRFVQT
jgi:hypothetical protein